MLTVDPDSAVPFTFGALLGFGLPGTVPVTVGAAGALVSTVIASDNGPVVSGTPGAFSDAVTWCGPSAIAVSGLTDQVPSAATLVVPRTTPST